MSTITTERHTTERDMTERDVTRPTTWSCDNCHHEIHVARRRCTECGTSRF